MTRLLLLSGTALGGCDLAATAPSVFRDDDALLSLVSLAAILVLVLGFGGWRDLGGFGKALRNFALIALLFLGLILGYAYKDDFGGIYQRLRGAVLPHSPQSAAGGAVTLQRGAGGHFSTVASVNGRSTVFLVDTGASSVVLPFEEAVRLGYDPANLSFTRRVSTAKGDAFEAPITIRSLEVGDIVLNDVSASVAEAGNLDRGLLGMSFLNRLSGYSFEGDRLTLRP